MTPFHEFVMTFLGVFVGNVVSFFVVGLYDEMKKTKAKEYFLCKHPGCGCVCGHQKKCPEDGPSLTSDGV